MNASEVTDVNFFKLLKPFSQIQDAAADQNYSELPDSWSILITDIKNSTLAIADGHYRQVNMAGVLSIIAVKNILNDFDFPYVFGGDGATLALPNEYVEKAMQALEQTKERVTREFDLILRFGFVTYVELKESGSKIEVGKFQSTQHVYLAMLRGDGITEAEKIIKSEQVRSRIKKTDMSSMSENTDLFRGLECRWNPVPSKKGLFLTTIIIPTKQSSPDLLQNLIQNIFLISQNSGKAFSKEQIPRSWPPGQLKNELKIKYSNLILQKIVYLLALGWTWFVSLFLKRADLNKKNGLSDYINDLIANTDFLKLEGGLKFVIDTTTLERQKMIDLFQKYHEQGLIFYGYSESSTAVFTCFVRSLSQHIHFVDGGGGGYTMAAVMLKSQISSKKK